ncbi:MAG TPA: PEP/pyruvate-binding domain-containing protein, partial [Vicinamibacteria bacterium]|nr:PEP/pyruvate-binding domain-containing protein [Vicinamibacteria bacterium]
MVSAPAATPGTLLWLDDVAEGDRPRVGAKAWALARLRREGLPVPDGFVVPADAEEPARPLIEEACARLGAVAVRSSAQGEDGAEASFAGQYATVLDVRGAADVLSALRQCRTARATAYAAATGLAGGDEAHIAVLVQRFVEPRVAGVAFTRDPRDPGALLVESHAGRGEALVSGAVTPVRDVVDRASGGRRPSGGQGLAPADLEAVAVLARRAEAVFGAPQDGEWAIGADGPVLLQSRPITVGGGEALDPRIERLTRANVGEVLPDAVTPLTASVLGVLLEHGVEEVARRAGRGGGGGAP